MSVDVRFVSPGISEGFLSYPAPGIYGNHIVSGTKNPRWEYCFHLSDFFRAGSCLNPFGSWWNAKEQTEVPAGSDRFPTSKRKHCGSVGLFLFSNPVYMLSPKEHLKFWMAIPYIIWFKIRILENNVKFWMKIHKYCDLNPNPSKKRKVLDGNPEILWFKSESFKKT